MNRVNVKKKVSFILHPLNVSEFYEKRFLYAPFETPIAILLKKFSPFLVKKFFSLLPPHSFLKISNFTPPSGVAIELEGIMCPMFPEELITNIHEAVKKIGAAINCAIARKADIVVLTGFTSIIIAEGKAIEELLQRTDAPMITSGNALTAGLCIKGILKATQTLGVNIKESSVAIIGATGDIGSTCARVLAPQVKRMILVSRKISTDSDIVKEIRGLSIADVDAVQSPGEATKRADIILTATSSVVPLISPNDVKDFSIVCDVSLPYNIDNNFRKAKRNVFVFDGGKARLNDYRTNSLKWLRMFNNNNGVYGCLAEGILFGISEALKETPLGRGHISADQVNFLTSFSHQQGIDVSSFSFHGEPYLQTEIYEFQNKFLNRK